MERFEDNLWESVLERHGDELALLESSPVASSSRRRPPRRGVLAGGTLGLAGLGAGLVLALGGSTAPPAYAITTSSDGSVLVTYNYEGPQTWFDLEHDLIGEHDEMVAVEVAGGPAAAPGPMKCTPSRDGYPGLPSTPVEVELGQNGTGTIPTGDTDPVPDGTGAGPVHMTDCQVMIEKPDDNGGDTGGRTPGLFGFNAAGQSTVGDSGQ